VLYEGGAIRVRGKNPEQCRVHPQQRRGEGPDGKQHYLAAEVVANLYILLVLMGRVVYLVVTPGLEEEVAGLPADHRHQPADQRRGRWVLEDQAVGG